MSGEVKSDELEPQATTQSRSRASLRSTPSMTLTAARLKVVGERETLRSRGPGGRGGGWRREEEEVEGEEVEERRREQGIYLTGLASKCHLGQPTSF